MPAISLVVCLYKQRDLLERLLQHADGCYDDLVLIHDGPEDEVRPPIDSLGIPGKAEPYIPTTDPFASRNPNNPEGTGIVVPSHLFPKMAVDFSIPGEADQGNAFWRLKTGVPKPNSIHELVGRYGGRTFEGVRQFTHEPHWPFAWSVCENDWVLLWDADEYPDENLRRWLKAFREGVEQYEGISGFTCIWPLWNGRSSPSLVWPDGRLFLINRKKVRYCGIGEFRPQPDTEYQSLDLILHHRPDRKSYGYRNSVLRKMPYLWRRKIALSLLKTPLQLPRWRWSSDQWPQPFAKMVESPVQYGLSAALLTWRWVAKSLWKHRLWRVLYSAPCAGWHHALICLDLLLLRKLQKVK